MSLMSMRRNMASKRTVQYIIWVLVAVFIAGIFLVFGKFPGSQNINQQVGDEKVIAIINDEEVTAGVLRQQYMDQMDQVSNEQKGLEATLMIREQLANQIVSHTIALQAAKELGVKRAWNWESKIRKVANDIAADQLAQMHEMARDQAKKEIEEAAKPVEKGAKPVKPRKEAELFQLMLNSNAQSIGFEGTEITEKTFTKLFVNQLMSKDKGGKYEVLVNYATPMIIGEKIAAGIDKSPLEEEFVKKLYSQEAKASWIFIAATEQTPKALADAEKKAKSLRDEISKDVKLFSEKARESNDFMSAFQGGSLGAIKPGAQSQTQPIAEYMAMAYEPGTITPLMAISLSSPWGGEPQVGYAFMLVEEVKPRDKEELKSFNWAKQKDTLMLRAKMRYARAFGDNYLAVRKINSKITYQADEQKYYQARNSNKIEIAQKLERQLMVDQTLPLEVADAFKYRVATTQYSEDLQKRARLFMDIKASGAPAETKTIYFDIGSAYVEKGDKEQAVLALELVMQLSEGDTDQKMHRSLKEQYSKLGDKEAVAKIDEWLKAHPEEAKPDGANMPISIGQ